jgi:hypothetical protein
VIRVKFVVVVVDMIVGVMVVVVVTVVMAVVRGGRYIVRVVVGSFQVPNRCGSMGRVGGGSLSQNVCPATDIIELAVKWTIAELYLHQ